MFGLFYLGWLTLTVVLVGLVLLNLIRLFREPESRRRTAVKMVVQLAVFATVTWPFLLGRAVFELNCRYRSGLSIEQTVDLRNGGYLIWPDAFDKDVPGNPLWNSRGYDHQGVQDLLMGRISFFEKPVRKPFGDSSSDRISYERFQLGDSRGRGCVNSETEEEMLIGLRLPAGRCITRSVSRDSLADYRLEGEFKGYPAFLASSTRSNSRLEFVSRESDDRVAKYRRFTHWSGMVADAGSKVYECPTARETFDHSPLRGLTAFVLRDDQGEVATFEALRRWQAAKPPDNTSNFGELPPRTITGQSDAEADPVCRAESLRGQYPIYKVQTYGGWNAIPVRLDDSNSLVGQVEVVVNHPDQPVIIWLSAHDPVVWHISQTAESRIAAVLVKGTHGQAVLGLDRSVPLFVASDYHAPGSNCYPTEIGAVHGALFGDVAPMHVTDLQGKQGPHFALVGTVYPTRWELLYSQDRALEDFTMDLPEPRLPRNLPREPLRFSPDPMQ